MAIIKKYNKDNGTTYVYESISYWDKEKQQPRSKRKLIGKLDPITGEVVPTNGRGRKPKTNLQESLSTDENADEQIKPNQINSDQIGSIGLSLSSDATDSADFKRLYEESIKLLLEKDAAIANLEASIARLIKEKQDLISKMEQMLREYKR